MLFVLLLCVKLKILWLYSSDDFAMLSLYLGRATHVSLQCKMV